VRSHHELCATCGYMLPQCKCVGLSRQETREPLGPICTRCKGIGHAWFDCPERPTRSVEVAASLWVSTSARLPEPGSVVLAYWPAITSFDAMYGVVKYERRNARHELNCQIWSNPGDDEDDYAIPSHWMPLPAAPEAP
jgi:hypothetical protein